jgi:hypothetical protein
MARNFKLAQPTTTPTATSNMKSFGAHPMSLDAARHVFSESRDTMFAAALFCVRRSLGRALG